MKPSRYISGALALVLALALQASAAHAQVATADARNFVGTWDVAFEGEQPMTVVLLINDVDGQLAATATLMEATNTVTSLRKVETALVLGYSLDYQGQAVAISITMTPGTDGVTASLDAAQGMYTASGRATKR